MQNEDLDTDDMSVIPMALISNSKTLKTIHARLTPTKGNFNVEAFEDWLGGKTNKGKGKEYIKLQAKTTAGQKRLAWFHKFIDLDETFWEQPLHVTYIKLLLCVQKEGLLGGWGMGAEKGLHRKCANLMSLTCGSIDMKAGTLEPHSLTEEDFVLCGILTATGRSDQEFREQFFTNVFNGKEEKAMALTVKYYNSAGINAAEAAWHSRAHSQSVAESKKNSVD